MTRQVLCCWPDPADPMLARVKKALLPLRLRVRTAGPEAAGQPVGFLLGRDGVPPRTGTGEAPPVPDPILILDGLNGPELDAVLRTLARAKVPRSVFKAVATPDNEGWTLAALWDELKREREALARGDAPAHGSP